MHVRDIDWEARRRTIRRKKSSYDLRDIFRNGGFLPETPARVF